MPNSEYWRERDARSLIPRGRDKAENSEEASRETAHKVAKRTHEDDQLPELQTKLDACVKKLAKIQEQFEECQNILVECQRELSEYTAASKKAESGSDGRHGVFKIVELHPDWQFSCANVKQIFSGSGVESNSTNAPIFVQKPQPRYLGAA
ncbi:hypothetical protein C8J55DRAFT_265314 [Lentinula edodes]|uniref:Uncharacterized protein n=1 Tax=Lentinula lateritia TaxID=40482 RepID=A0A9W8ZT00_9AGAR|nr:hypothetical protein C8J55DRAFT_265314 [Lentinula edodes]